MNNTSHNHHEKDITKVQRERTKRDECFQYTQHNVVLDIWNMDLQCLSSSDIQFDSK